MNPHNIERIATLANGTQLLISTQRFESGSFACQLYVANPDQAVPSALQEISHHFEASTCLEAQEHARIYAQRLYPDVADQMKKPPYLIK